MVDSNGDQTASVTMSAIFKQISDSKRFMRNLSKWVIKGHSGRVIFLFDLSGFIPLKTITVVGSSSAFGRQFLCYQKEK